MNKTTIDGKRYYDIEGEKYASVTTILNIIDKGYFFYQWLLKNSKEDADKQTQTACDIGTRVHSLIEAHGQAKINNVPFDPKLQEDEKKPYSAYLKWESEHKVEYLKTELFLYSKTHKYAGTCDIVAKIDDHLAVIDIKTSARFYDTMGLQLSAYKAAYEEMTKNKVGRLFILRLDKEKGTPHFKEYKDEFDVFLSALYLFNWRNNGPKQQKQSGN